MLVDIFIDLFLLIIQFLLWKRLSGKWLNHISVINLLWLSMTGLSKLQPWDLYLPSEKTYGYVYLMLVTFNVVSLFIFKKRRYSTNGTNRISIKPDYIMLGATLFSTAVLAYNIPKFWGMFLVGGFTSLRSNYLAGDDGELHVGVFITWFISSIIMSAAILSIVQILKSEGKKKIAIITLILNFVNVCMYVIITGGRFIFVMFLMAIVIELWLHNKGNIGVMIKRYKKWGVLVIVCLYVVEAVTAERSLNDMGLIGNLYVYFFATINLFDHFISPGGDPHLYELMYGENLIGGLTTPFIVLSNKYLGTDYEIPLAVIQSSTCEFTYVSPHFWMNNNCTFLYGALRDFGAWGILIYTFIWAFLLNWAYKISQTKKIILGESMYVYFLVVSVLLLFEWMPCRPNIFFTAIFIYIFYRLNAKSIKVQ